MSNLPANLKNIRGKLTRAFRLAAEITDLVPSELFEHYDDMFNSNGKFIVPITKIQHYRDSSYNQTRDQVILDMLMEHPKIKERHRNDLDESLLESESAKLVEEVKGHVDRLKRIKNNMENKPSRQELQSDLKQAYDFIDKFVVNFYINEHPDRYSLKRRGLAKALDIYHPFC